jgi:hypothetical protein
VSLVAKTIAKVSDNMNMHKQVPPVYYKFLLVFVDTMANALSSNNSYNSAIHLIDSDQLP